MWYNYDRKVVTSIVLRKDELKIGYLYFYIHFFVEVVCFFYLSRVTSNAYIVWLVPFIYDGMAFVPQSVIGYFADKYPKINMGFVGVGLLLLSYLIYAFLKMNLYLSLIILCLGNAFLHVAGAEATLRNSDGKLSPVAIFVSGGSFGVITGKLLAKTAIPAVVMLVPILSMIPFILLANTYHKAKSDTYKFDYVDTSVKSGLIIIIAVLVVVVRGYMGYGIPTTWNKTVFESILFFVTMGIGKALGGILSDKYGIRKMAIISTLLAIPFLCFGDNIMIISLIGIMLFSMTMSITLGILVSVLKDAPGLAFGLTTIGLFLGTVPIFFIKLNMLINIIIIIVFSVVCMLLLKYVLRKDAKNGNNI